MIQQLLIQLRTINSTCDNNVWWRENVVYRDVMTRHSLGQLRGGQTEDRVLNNCGQPMQQLHVLLCCQLREALEA